ncbi:hypothetical protein M406DRAFT_74001 [Cryphonectria parasitica EP155]|uniref:Uncharacterized protein n=1 Tax=Cryphonectria parasitica (strain ATCC 38755 / EP155) TaxID=660469 RepID=A0A9P5CMZ3_CRYP1|nr:uncharacterized protein M406DRAFT_74001 [Cryphonectria parasitica EP155]KAF3763385.1 hypothetical protein M406DRAFT_74001 [Cryphonectria parasitica EP155]
MQPNTVQRRVDEVPSRASSPLIRPDDGDCSEDDDNNDYDDYGAQGQAPRTSNSHCLVISTTSTNTPALDIATLGSSASPLTTDIGYQARTSAGAVVGLTAASISFFLVVTGGICFFSRLYQRRALTPNAMLFGTNKNRKRSHTDVSWVRNQGPIRLNPVTPSSYHDTHKDSWRTRARLVRPTQPPIIQTNYDIPLLPDPPAPVQTRLSRSNAQRARSASLGCLTTYESTMSPSSTITWRYGTGLTPAPRCREGGKGMERHFSLGQLSSKTQDVRYSMPSTACRASNSVQSQDEFRLDSGCKETPKEESQERCRSWPDGSNSTGSNAMSALAAAEIEPCPSLNLPSRSSHAASS